MGLYVLGLMEGGPASRSHKIQVRMCGFDLDILLGMNLYKNAWNNTFRQMKRDFLC